MQQSRPGGAKTRAHLEQADHLGRIGECVHVATPASEPTVQPVAKRARIRHGHVEQSARLQHPGDLRDGSVQIGEMFKTVIRQDRVETPVAKREARRIRLNEDPCPGALRLDIDRDQCHPALDYSGKAPARAPQIQHPRAGRERRDHFLHLTCAIPLTLS